MRASHDLVGRAVACARRQPRVAADPTTRVAPRHTRRGSGHNKGGGLEGEEGGGERFEPPSETPGRHPRTPRTRTRPGLWDNHPSPPPVSKTKSRGATHPPPQREPTHTRTHTQTPPRAGTPAATPPPVCTRVHRCGGGKTQPKRGVSDDSECGGGSAPLTLPPYHAPPLPLALQARVARGRPLADGGGRGLLQQKPGLQRTRGWMHLRTPTPPPTPLPTPRKPHRHEAQAGWIHWV